MADSNVAENQTPATEGGEDDKAKEAEEVVTLSTLFYLMLL